MLCCVVYIVCHRGAWSAGYFHDFKPSGHTYSHKPRSWSPCGELVLCGVLDSPATIHTGESVIVAMFTCILLYFRNAWDPKPHTPFSLSLYEVCRKCTMNSVPNMHSCKSIFLLKANIKLQPEIVRYYIIGSMWWKILFQQNQNAHVYINSSFNFKCNDYTIVNHAKFIVVCWHQHPVF